MPGSSRKRKTVTKLGTGDFIRINGLIDAALNGGADWVGTTVFAELDRLAKHSQSTADQQFADRAMKILTIERLDAYGKERARETGTLVNLGHTQAFLSDTRSHRVRIYTVNGVAFAWQQSLWWREDWDVLAQMIQATVSQQDTLGEKAAAMRRGYALRDDFPKAKNVEEACGMLGVTVEEFLATAP